MYIYMYYICPHLIGWSLELYVLVTSKIASGQGYILEHIYICDYIYVCMCICASIYTFIYMKTH